jgi:hypothetical protein
MLFILLALGGLAYLHYGVKKNPTSGEVCSTSTSGARVQPISWQAAQGFAQGNNMTPSQRHAWQESNRAVAQPQNKIQKGTNSAAGTDRILSDLLNKIASTFDPQWRMRYMNAYHRMTLQSQIDNGQAPTSDLNVDRTDPYVNDDTGEASGFTRTQITYQQRFTRGRVRPGYGPNATRVLDQEDPGDQTAIQTPLQPNGFKTIIYPSTTVDRNKINVPWCGLKTVNLERDYWAKNGRPYNQVGATQSDMPVSKGWNWGFIIPKRGKHGAYPSGKNLPGRSNRHNDQVNSGKC